MQNNKCGRCGGSTLKLDKYDILGNFVETNRKCISCGREQKAPASRGRNIEGKMQKGVDMGKELTEEEKEKKRTYQRKWYKENSEWARRKEKTAIAPGAEQKEGQNRECKYHAGVAATVDKNGRTSGLCKECMVKRARKSQEVRFGKSKKKRPSRTLPAKVGARGSVPLPRIVAEHDGKIFIPTAQLVQPAAELRFELIYKLADAKVLTERV